MVTESAAKAFAESWIGAWNAHDLEAVMAHYAEEAVLISPTAAKLLGDATGTVRGKAELQSYFSRGLEAFPNLRFALADVLVGLASVLLYYTNQKGTKTGEFMELDADGKVVRVVANYSME